TLSASNTAKTITIGENHSALAGNPHNTTAAQLLGYDLRVRQFGAISFSNADASGATRTIAIPTPVQPRLVLAVSSINALLGTRFYGSGSFGVFALCEPELEKEMAVGEIVKGLVSGGAADKYDAVHVTDADQALAFIAAPLHHVVVAETAKGKAQASIEAPKVFRLLIQSDAPDVHPVDGIPEIKADGTSFTTITVQKADERGEAH